MSQNANNLSFILGKNVLTNGVTIQSNSNNSFQNPQQNTFYNQSNSQNIILNQKHNVNQSNQAPVSTQQQNIFQSSPQNPTSPQLNIKPNKPTNTTQKPATKYTKIPTLATNNNSNHISLDGYFPTISAQTPSPTQNISPAINANIQVNPLPYLPSPPTAPPTPYLFDPNYHF